MRYHSRIALVLLTLSQAAVAAPSPASPSLDEALRIAERARSAAAARKREVSIVIVNREGRVLLAHRMDGASFSTIDVAREKAITAADVGEPTRLLESVPQADKVTSLTVPGLAMIAGGVPILKDGHVIGGLGVSGAASSEDDEIAVAALGPPAAAKQ